MDISWIKVKVEMFNDQKIKLIETFPEADSIIVIWIKLLTLAGKINDGGLIYVSKTMAYNDEMLSAVFNRKVSTIRLALKTLSDFDMIEIYKSGEIGIVNWDKHQNIEGLDKIREQNRIRQKNFREKQKLKSLETPVNKGKKDNVTLRITQHNGTEEEEDKELDKEVKNTNSENEDLKSLKDSFDLFHSKFLGEKRKEETELKNLMHCFPYTEWQQIIPLLNPAIDEQIKYKEYQIEKDNFSPQWKSLNNWIQKKCWEIHIPKFDSKNIIKQTNGKSKKRNTDYQDSKADYGTGKHVPLG